MSDEPTLRSLIDAAEASGDWGAVADWCENFDWLSTTDLPAHDFWLDIAARCEAAIAAPTDVSRQQISEAVEWARDEGSSWERIGELLGTSAAEAEARYGSAASASHA